MKWWEKTAQAANQQKEPIQRQHLPDNINIKPHMYA
jgi:hypothetical protein